MQRLWPHVFFLIFSLVAITVHAQERYEVRYHLVDKDTLASPESAGLRAVFSSRKDCFFYMENLLKNRRALGYLAFSIDSLYYSDRYAEAWIHVGTQYQWTNLSVDRETTSWLEAAAVDPQQVEKMSGDPKYIEELQRKVLTYMENNGHPFAAFGLDSVRIDGERISGKWAIQKGPLYRIDSITITGGLRISSGYLERYLGIEAGSIYRKDRLDQVSARLRELPFLQESQPWEMTMVATGSALHLYLEPKKNSQINALAGFLPSNGQLNGKLLLTGEANLLLRNATGNGETIGLNWQQLQVKSPRLHLLYQHPYLFRSAFGADLQFDLFRKDSSFLNLNARTGVQFQLDRRQQGSVFYQHMATNLIGVDTVAIKTSRTLPPQLDVRSGSLGLEYQFNGTDYRFNPRNGSEFSFLISAGLRRIRKNSFITDLEKDAQGRRFSFKGLYDSLTLRSYLLRARMQAVRYFPTGKASTLRASVQAGMLAAEGVYRNELYQLGGYRLLRGFDEESIYADRFGVVSAEYRYLIGKNAFLFAFTDGGWARLREIQGRPSHFYLGTGLGVSLETRSGFLNLSYAVGKRDEQPFSFRQAKIHFGFVSIF